MKLQKLLALFLVMVLAFSTVSCDDDDDDAEPTRTALLTGGQWTGTALFLGTQDISDWLIDEDDPDNSFDVKKWKVTFNSNGTYSSTYDGSAAESGRWEFTNNEQSILFDKGTADEETARINQLTSSELYIVQAWETEDNQTVDIEARFAR
ncbi:hypothetical protein [uncultured Pontibacter sp.]|uniref:hypothetical protein n=1 Tax=uncultured Pontibacter sp. TaxID=453356 RepID=UPI002618F71D|nr:hypothetical protein [uncultured Pontibacter sp.]